MAGSSEDKAAAASTRLWLKHAGMQLVAGGSAGCVEVSLMHPLDLVKTRYTYTTLRYT